MASGSPKVVRIIDGRRVKATDLVLPQDTLVVPERFV